jgi:tRNA(His) 5'-end guanylyltransferase
MASPISSDPAQLTSITSILDKKHKDLTKFEYVIDREVISTAPVGKYIVIRVDGRRFKGFADEQKWYRPIDDRPYKLMNRVAAEVMSIYDGKIMFASGQSDEMSFFFQQNTDLYRRRVDKIMSTIVSTFTSYYISLYKEYINDTVCPFDINLHQAGPFFYSDTSPTIHPCGFTYPSLIATGELNHPISINKVQFNDSSPFGQTDSENHTLNEAKSVSYPWCERYGHVYSKWCPFNHHSHPHTPQISNIVPKNLQTKKKPPHLPVFDGKIILLNNEQEVYDYISWRQVDTHINNQYNVLFYLLTTPPSHPLRSTNPTIPLPLQPTRIYTPQEAEAMINGTNSTEKVLLLQKLLNIDYFSLPASYKRNSLIFWSDYLPSIVHHEQQELFNFDHRDSGGIIQNVLDEEEMNSRYTNTITKYTARVTTTTQLYLTQQYSQLKSFSVIVDKCINFFQNDQNKYDGNFNTKFFTFLFSLIYWFFHTQNRNLAFPSSLLQLINHHNSPQNDPILPHIIALKAQIDDITTLLQLSTTNNTIPELNPHFILPNLSGIMSRVAVYDEKSTTLCESCGDKVINCGCTASGDDETLNNDGDKAQTINPALGRHIVVYHGDLIGNAADGLPCSQQNVPTDNDNPLDFFSAVTFPIPHTNPQFWSSHDGLFPHVSTRQKQLQLKKDLKKLRKKQHVENRRKIREYISSLSIEEKNRLENNDEIDNTDRNGHNGGNKNEGSFKIVVKGEKNNDSKSQHEILLDSSKHLGANPNWAKRRLKYDKYYSIVGIDSTIQAKSIEINKLSNSNRVDPTNQQQNDFEKEFSIFNKTAQIKANVHQINPEIVAAVVDFEEDIYNGYNKYTNERWLSKSNQEFVLDYLLQNWSNSRTKKN